MDHATIVDAARTIAGCHPLLINSAMRASASCSEQPAALASSVEVKGRPSEATYPFGLWRAAIQRHRIQKPCAAKEHRRSSGSLSQSFQKNMSAGF